MSKGFSTPIVLIVFKRTDTARRVFEAVREIRPAKLLVIADGARPDRAGEAELCAKVREIVTAVDWPCELLTNFSDVNLGCDPRVVSGLDWVFSLVEEAIILEDDCLPDRSFFLFCDEMLRRYRGNCKIGTVTGTNYVHHGVPAIRESYYFGILASLWGWATWRDRWQQYDKHLEAWPELREAGALAEIFDDPKTVASWTRIFNEAKEHGDRSPWDYRWAYTNIFQHRLSIIPKVNLVENIGFGAGATHTVVMNRWLLPKPQEMEFPLVHPQAIIWNRSFDRIFGQRQYGSMIHRFRIKLRRLRERLFGKLET